jgi:cyclohexa-1,5-dienecarbonyl-CoA hydratase
MNKIKVEYLFENSVAKVTLNSPKGNVLDAVMMGELKALFDEFAKIKSLKLITFEGEGNHFSFGASVEEHTKDLAGQMLKSFHGLFYSLIELGIPTAAKVKGQCLGGAMELCLMCNFVFADKSAKFGQPEISLGVFPPPASILLPLKIGSARAEELLLTGKTISADEAFKAGLVNGVYENTEELEEGISEFINKNILPKSALSLRYALMAARGVFNQTLKTELPLLETMYVNDLMNTDDANEGINSFLEKRKPIWKNS